MLGGLSAATSTTLRSLLNPHDNRVRESTDFAFDMLSQRLQAEGASIRDNRWVLVSCAIGGATVAAYGLAMALGFGLQNTYTISALVLVGAFVSKLDDYIHYGLQYSTKRRLGSLALALALFAAGKAFNAEIVVASLLCLIFGIFYCIINSLALRDGGYIKRMNIARAAQSHLSTLEFSRCIAGVKNVMASAYLVIENGKDPNRDQSAIISNALDQLEIKSGSPRPSPEIATDPYYFFDDEKMGAALWGLINK